MNGSCHFLYTVESSFQAFLLVADVDWPGRPSSGCEELMAAVPCCVLGLLEDGWELLELLTLGICRSSAPDEYPNEDGVSFMVP